ncbi:hypothetical protein GA0115233_106740 [Streptomyces sp. DI166]|uniref:DUF6578 domain-containing protein n=1 Tax=Streptomyces sp. DI166 TaxID=1839783 RepID=UPI0007F4BA50|nr:DUF6578 domain-containing protein [Streptomyces sp. DI166]SBT93621.1 hypothetical protein GA0115233_106740 [Streptomyces sp. DI166]
MGKWKVFYEDWQMECCGTPFAVGDEVSWPLLLIESGDWDDEVSKVVGEVAQVNGVRVLNDDSGLTVALHEDSVDQVAPEDLGEEKPGDRIRLVGLLSVERHGAQWPDVTGRVADIHLVSQEYAETDPASRTWEPVPGTRTLRPVEACPKWFTEAEPHTQGRHVREAGVLVTLEVPDH